MEDDLLAFPFGPSLSFSTLLILPAEEYSIIACGLRCLRASFAGGESILGEQEIVNGAGRVHRVRLGLILLFGSSSPMTGATTATNNQDTSRRVRARAKSKDLRAAPPIDVDVTANLPCFRCLVTALVTQRHRRGVERYAPPRQRREQRFATSQLLRHGNVSPA